MKVKELIEELQKFNPDGVVTVNILAHRGTYEVYGKVDEVVDDGCSMINPQINATE